MGNPRPPVGCRDGRLGLAGISDLFASEVDIVNDDEKVSVVDTGREPELKLDRAGDLSVLRERRGGEFGARGFGGRVGAVAHLTFTGDFVL